MGNSDTMEPAFLSVTNNTDNRKFLIVEDEPDINNLIAEIVQMGGYGTVKAYNSIEGIHFFREHAQDILAVILDMGTQKIERSELFYRMKEIRPESKIFIMSNYFENEVRTKLTYSGAAGFIQKPFTKETILATLSKSLGTGIHTQAGLTATVFH